MLAGVDSIIQIKNWMLRRARDGDGERDSGDGDNPNHHFARVTLTRLSRIFFKYARSISSAEVEHCAGAAALPLQRCSRAAARSCSTVNVSSFGSRYCVTEASLKMSNGSLFRRPRS